MPLSQPMRSKAKTNRDELARFSRATSGLLEIVPDSDWFIALFASIVIGQRSLVWLYETQLKIALKNDCWT